LLPPPVSCSPSMAFVRRVSSTSAFSLAHRPLRVTPFPGTTSFYQPPPTPFTYQIRNAGGLKEIKNRLRSVASIAKITASMKLVSASKLRVMQKNLELASPFIKSSQALVKDQLPENLNIEDPSKHVLVVPITSDRGLCGAINNGIIRWVKAFSKRHGQNWSLISLGEKARLGLSREYSSHYRLSAGEIGKKTVHFSEVVPIAEHIANQKFDIGTIVYNQFLTVLTSEIRQIVFPHISQFSKLPGWQRFELDDADDALMDDMFTFWIACSLYGALVTNAAAEFGARMTSMDNATRNAGDMIKALALLHNRRRQAAITTELTEIISGAEALVDEE